LGKVVGKLMHHPPGLVMVIEAVDTEGVAV
jgi:hypothetical protein